MINITDRFIQTGTKRRSGAKLKGIKFLVAHDTGNDGTSAATNAAYFVNSANAESASAHFFVDDKQIIRVIPEDEKAWHVQYLSPIDNQMFGVDANDYAIGVELCFHSRNTLIDNLKSYRNYVDLFAYLCTKYSIDPAKFIVGHETLDPSRRSDPSNALRYVGKTVKLFVTDVVAAMRPIPAVISAPVSIGQSGASVSAVQAFLIAKGYKISDFRLGVYDEEMAKSVLYFQMVNNAADAKELSGLRGERVGPKTISIINNHK